MNIIYAMRYKIFTTALILVLPFFVTACSLRDLPVIGDKLPANLPFSGSNAGEGATVPQDPVEITVWGLWEDPAVMEILIAKYKEQHPNVTINYDDRSVLELIPYKEAVYKRASEANAPDIMMVHNSWVPGLKSAISPMPSGMMSTDEYSQKFYPSAVQAAIHDGKIHAVPTYYDGLVLVYNKKHFEEINQVEPPSAWEEFRRLAIELTVVGDKDELIRSGAAIGLADNIQFAPDILGLMFAQAGVNVPDDLDSVPAKDAVVFYSNFAYEDGVWSREMPVESVAFAQEKVSMIFVPSWMILDIINLRPDLEIGVAPVPQAVEEDPVSWGTFWMGTVPSGSNNKEVAWDFLKFLTEQEQQMTLYNEASKYRDFGTPYSLSSLSSELSGNKYLAPIVDSAGYSRSGILSGRAGNKTSEESVATLINSIEKLGGTSFDDKLDTFMTEFKDKIANTR